MRQKKATCAIGVVSVVLLGVLIAFGCERSAEHHHEEAMEEAEAGHMTEGEHHEEMEEAGHAEAAHGHEHETMAAQAQTRLEPSGKVVDGVRVVDVVARQFEFEPATIVVRRGERIRLEVTSEDVIHGIGIEAYDINEPLPPGETKEIEFTADKAGTHHFHCAVYCGRGHNDMHGELVVLEESESPRAP